MIEIVCSPAQPKSENQPFDPLDLYTSFGPAITCPHGIFPNHGIMATIQEVFPEDGISRVLKTTVDAVLKMSAKLKSQYPDLEVTPASTLHLHAMGHRSPSRQSE
jgi:hypothetical protein